MKRKSPTCADCGIHAPDTNSDETLLSVSLGWRLSRAQQLVNGERALEWRCPSCWRKHKAGP